MTELQLGLAIDTRLIVQRIGSEIYEGIFGKEQSSGEDSALDQLRSTNVFVADIEYDCVRLQRQIHALRLRSKLTNFLYGIMLADRNQPVPVDYDWLADYVELRRPGSSLRDIARLHRELPLEKVSAETAVQGFIEALESFLRARIRGSESGPPPGFTGPNTPRPMLAFRVHTKQPGGRVHFTRAYYQSYRNVFGSPTTPVVGWIDPGIYGFLVEYVGGQPFFDPGVYDVPPSTDAHLMY